MHTSRALGRDCGAAAGSLSLSLSFRNLFSTQEYSNSAGPDGYQIFRCQRAVNG